jgi:[1-hydroxy-2-(trimethylamino)ethyl]phosphonate dioxygenase
MVTHSEAVDRIIRIYHERGQGRYGSEKVSQIEHAIQCACLAQEADAKPTLVAASLLHDLGHIIDDSALPSDDSSNLDDHHEERAYQWLCHHFGLEIAEPVRLHVMAKRYLCTVETGYLESLSPTSLKSFYDQGGLMSSQELDEFRTNPFFEDAIQLRRWDDEAKDENKTIPAIDDYAPLLLSLCCVQQ